MTQTSTKRQSSTAQRIAEKTLDLAVGGTALAAEKVSETVGRAIEKSEGAIRKGRHEVREKAEAASRAARQAVEDRDARPYEDRTRDELYELAIQREIDGRSSMRKSELIDALRSAR